MDCTCGFYLEIHIFNPSPNLTFFIDQFWNILFCHFFNQNRECHATSLALCQHLQRTGWLKYCHKNVNIVLGELSYGGDTLFVAPWSLGVSTEQSRGWYQLKQKPDRSHTGTGDLPGLSADVSDNNVSLSHYYIKIPLAPGHFPRRCGRFLWPPCYDTPKL